jgi:NADH dehydrogenase [ubiquinone] 1 alpha subcomplex assembly factor 6
LAHNPKISAVAQLVRRHDRDRFATALFAAPERREALWTLYAFNYEAARIREAVSEPILGSIRLQWWREAVDAAVKGEPARQHEVAAPLAETIKAYGLGAAEFNRILDAREQDMLADPPQTLAALESYAAATGGSLVVMALEVLNAIEPENDGKYESRAEIAGRHVGTAYALSGLLRAAAFHARAGRSYIPVEFDPKRSVLNLKPTPELAAAARAIAGAARIHLAKARALKDGVPRRGIAALLPAVLAETWLARLEACRYDLFNPRLAAPDPWRSLRLWRAVRAGRF